jgi:hypothetical protein
MEFDPQNSQPNAQGRIDDLILQQLNLLLEDERLDLGNDLLALDAFEEQLNSQSKILNPVYKCKTSFYLKKIDSNGLVSLSLICDTINSAGITCQYESKPPNSQPNPLPKEE